MFIKPTPDIVVSNKYLIEFRSEDEEVVYYNSDINDIAMDFLKKVEPSPIVQGRSFQIPLGYYTRVMGPTLPIEKGSLLHEARYNGFRFALIYFASQNFMPSGGSYPWKYKGKEMYIYIQKIDRFEEYISGLIKVNIFKLNAVWYFERYSSTEPDVYYSIVEYHFLEEYHHKGGFVMAGRKNELPTPEFDANGFQLPNWFI
jgi:hypothetical protein